MIGLTVARWRDEEDRWVVYLKLTPAGLRQREEVLTFRQACLMGIRLPGSGPGQEKKGGT